MSEILATPSGAVSMDGFKALGLAVVSGDISAAVGETRRLVDAGVAVQSILDLGLITAMDQVGENFSTGQIFIPQMLRSAKTMQECMKILEPYFKGTDVTSKGKVLIGTVQGDLHDIGKNLVSVMLEGAGFSVTDLGVDVTPAKFVETVRSLGPDIVAMSALLSTTMPSMSRTIAALEEAGLRHTVKVLVGGAPVTEKFAAEITADAFAADAGAAVVKAKEMLSVA